MPLPANATASPSASLNSPNFAWRIPPPWRSTPTRSALAPHLREPERDAALAEALAAASAIYEDSRAHLLAALAPQLPPALLAEALAVASAIRDERFRAEALTALGPYLPPALLASSLDILLMTCTRLFRPIAISTLVRSVVGIGIEQLGGEATARELAAAIVEVGRRWP